MNPLIQEAIGSVLRWAFTLGAGILIQKGIWTQEAATLYAGAFVTAALTLGWSLYQKYRMRGKLLVALSTPVPMTEQQAEKVVTQGPGSPPVTTAKTEQAVPNAP